MIEKGTRVRVSKDAESYDAADPTGTVIRVTMEGEFSVRLDKTGTIIRVPASGLSEIADDDDLWGRLSEQFDNNDDARLPADPLMAGASAMWEFSRETGDEAWDDLDRDDQLDVAAEFAAGFHAAIIATGNLSSDDQDEADQAAAGVRSAAELTIKGGPRSQADLERLLRQLSAR